MAGVDPNTKNDAPNDKAQQDAPKDDAAKTPPPVTTPETPPLPSDAPDWQALAQKWEKQAKNDRTSLEALKKQMQGLLTPEQVQDQAEAAATAAADRDRAATEALRLRVALEKGIPAAMADRLIGTTREELEKDAATVLALIPPTPPTPPPSRVPDAGAGTGRAPATKVDLNELLRTAAGVQA